MEEIVTGAPEEPQPMGKKSKKLTKAEKKQLKKQMKLEKKIAANEKQRQQKRDYLTRELKYNELNKKKLEKRWKQMLVDIKIPAIRKKYQYTVNNLERYYDAKDFKISILMDELDDANEQLGLNNRNHLESIEKLIKLFRDQLNHIKMKYDEDLNAVWTDENNSMKYFSKRGSYNEDFLNMMLYGLDVENKHEIKNIRSEYMSKISGETTWYSEILMNKRIEMSRVFDSMYQKYTEVFNDFLNFETRKPYEIIKKTDTDNRRKLNEHSDKILNCYDMIKRLKEAQDVQERELRIIENQMREEKKYFTNSFVILKNRLIKNEKNDEHKLIELTEQSNNIINHLKKIKSKGEKILRLMTVTSKYETQPEKILPFPKVYTLKNNTSSKQLQSSKVTYRKDSTFWHSIHEEIPRSLTPFWQKFAAIDTTRHILKEEELSLKKEKIYLQEKIKKYCTAASCRCMFPQVTQLYKPNKKPKPKLELKLELNDL